MSKAMNFFKNRQMRTNSSPVLPEPRQLDIINKEISQEFWELGQCEHQVYALKQEIAQKNQRIKDLNLEGARRNKLDAETKPDAITNPRGEE